MDTLPILGAPNPSIPYTDRPTVRALIFNESNQVLIINNGLLPGGGVETNENDLTALHREIMEEVGITVSDIQKLGTVTQYRDFLAKKYIVQGYIARYVNDHGSVSPQDEGESNFTYAWYSVEDAIYLLSQAIEQMEETEAVLDDAYQGKLFNLKTTKLFLDSLGKRSF